MEDQHCNSCGGKRRQCQSTSRTNPLTRVQSCPNPKPSSAPQPIKCPSDPITPIVPTPVDPPPTPPTLHVPVQSSLARDAIKTESKDDIIKKVQIRRHRRMRFHSSNLEKDGDNQINQKVSVKVKDVLKKEKIRLGLRKKTTMVMKKTITRKNQQVVRLIVSQSVSPAVVEHHMSSHSRENDAYDN